MADPASPTCRPWLRWLPFAAGAAFVGCAIAWANAGTMPPVFAWVGRQPWGDKVGHFVLIGTVAFLLDHALAGRCVRRVPLSAILVGVVMTAEEFSQIGSGTRAFEWGDLAANYAGIGAGLLAIRALRKRRARAAPRRILLGGSPRLFVRAVVTRCRPDGNLRQPVAAIADARPGSRLGPVRRTVHAAAARLGAPDGLPR